MKLNFTFILFFLILANQSFGQISDSTSMVYPKTFWNEGDQKQYLFSTKEFKLDENQVQQTEQYTYKVDIRVDNIFENEYVVHWKFKDIQFDKKQYLSNPFALLDSITIAYKMDEDGRFLNYIELDKTIDQFLNASEKVQNLYLNKEDSLQLIKQTINAYALPENIVKIFERDIKQFHQFYGKKVFTIGEEPFTYTSYMDNLFSNSPTPATSSIELKEINPSKTNYIMSSLQLADQEWLANAWYTYLSDLAEKLGTEKPSEVRLKDEITYQVATTSRIKDNGWILYSIETKKVKFQDTDYTLEKKFELIP